MSEGAKWAPGTAKVWVATRWCLGAVGPLQLPSWICRYSFVKIIHVNFQLIPRNFPEQLFLNKKTAENRNWHWASC